MSATPKPKVRPVTRWMVLYDGKFKSQLAWKQKAIAQGQARSACRRGEDARAIRVRIWPVPPRKKARKGAGR